MSRTPVRPFLIAKQPDGRYRLSTRETRYNSQGYPLVTETPHEDSFPTAAAARAFATAHFGAKAGEFSSS